MDLSPVARVDAGLWPRVAFAMRLLALALLCALSACSAEPLAACGAPGLARSCPCASGASGAQECGPGGAWTACVCEGAPDGGADAGETPPPPMDAPAVPEASADAPVPPDAPPDATDGPAEAGADVPLEAACGSLTPANCCGVSCPRGEAVAEATCVAGRCGIACEPWAGDCDGNPANGCEVDLTNTSTHCGACGAACAGGGRCVRAVCPPVCPAGRGNCDGDNANGCEAMTDVDASNCGACGGRCAGGRRCVSGACR